MKKEELLQFLIDNLKFIEQVKINQKNIQDVKNQIQNNYNIIYSSYKQLSPDDQQWINKYYSKWIQDNILNNSKYQNIIKNPPFSPDYIRKELERIKKQQEQQIK